MELLSNPDIVVQYLTGEVKQAKVDHVKQCTTGCRLPGGIVVFRAGEPQVSFAVHNGALRTVLPVVARLFNADMLGVWDDGVDAKHADGLRQHLVIAAVDRTPSVAWVHQPYQEGPYGLGWDLPNRHDLAEVVSLDEMLRDMSQMILAPRIHCHLLTMEEFRDVTEDFTDAARQAALDIAVIDYIKRLDIPGLGEVAVLSNKDSLRREMLNSLGAPIEA